MAIAIARAGRSRSRALAALDLLTGGDAHFTRTVLRADDSGALWDIVARRYELAGRAAVRGFMPAATLIALLAIACGLRYRDAAARAGRRRRRAGARRSAGRSPSASRGALFNDSGPVLLLFATFIAACVVLYVRGDPRLAGNVPARRTRLRCAVPARRNRAGCGACEPARPIPPPPPARIRGECASPWCRPIRGRIRGA